MNLPAELLPALLTWLGWLLLAPLAAWTLWTAPWRLLHRNLLEPVFAAAVLLTGGLWTMQVGAQAGLGLHFLGSSALVLVFGARLALAASLLALLALAALGIYDWVALGVNGLIGAALPVWLAHHLHLRIEHLFPRHYFVYVLVSAHFASMLALAAAALAGAALLWLTGIYPVDRIVNDYLVFLPVAMLPEGFLNGAIITMLTAFKPEWVRSFDDRDYLDGK
ncbi:MAG: hypothetical protein CVV18_02830 [Gammaproteobacteria bacterium HGW-Gammaproteobacteria-8]|nr:MAG: hypothetical protein CVV18_02830 [Gammaproteobacteria bacterium HGW-Gammaproteobacteria-8]